MVTDEAAGTINSSSSACKLGDYAADGGNKMFYLCVNGMNKTT